MSSHYRAAEYVLATGVNAVGRLEVLHSIYSPVGCQVLKEAGVTEGMLAADFGCGTGTMTRALASIVGPLGSVTGIDLHRRQLQEAVRLCETQGFANTRFVAADACKTGLPSNTFDVVYCRFLLLHLPDPGACLREMRRVLKPGGLIVVEDGDLVSATSIPRTALDTFADLFGQLGPKRGLNYSLENDLGNLVADAGFSVTGIRVHQPADTTGHAGLLLRWSVEEAGPAFVSEGLISETQLSEQLAKMDTARGDSSILTLAPRMSVVWGWKERACDGGGAIGSGD